MKFTVDEYFTAGYLCFYLFVPGARLGWSRPFRLKAGKDKLIGGNAHWMERTARADLPVHFIGKEAEVSQVSVFEHSGELPPGAEAPVTVRFLLGQPIEELLEVGRTWWLHEGSRKVGQARIVRLL